VSRPPVVSLLTVGSRGDVEPFVALALALARHGAQCRLITHARFRSLADSYGIPFWPLPGDPEQLMGTSAGREALASGKNFVVFLSKFRHLTESLAIPTWDAAWQAAQGSDVLVYSTFAYQGHYLGEALGIPSVSVHLQPVLPTREFASPALPFHLPSPWLRHLSHEAATALFWQFTRSTLRQLRARIPNLSVPLSSPIPQLLKRGSLVLVAVSPSVVPRPTDWPPYVHLTGYWFLPPPDNFSPPPALQDFLSNGPPPVYVGFGSLAQRDPLATRQMVNTALRQVGRRGVINPGWSGLDAATPSPDMYIVDNIPHRWLFPRTAAVVHHGGAGTTAAGLRAGVPAVLVPHFADQWFWAQRVEQLSAGASIPRARLTPDRLARAIDTALTMPFPAQLASQLQVEAGADRAARLVMRAR